ncbi:MarR family transcriptional regulator [Pseudoalteromonas luteoviolacea]|uniref:MarR family winged helix-turn-helix transcriptional regulator n=1 Tax=Pseudoalteromonas luteoviolacea TaxID=43657 RepID=UPI001B39F07E|nr:MarR family transcriptional regulator [Pseudoalteromonas luteoviolacea]MBQ4876769.1 MarR family transcriptional regulator [Pseudoalteromonas luteoviolacea]MBQ4905442.1 MarR family transcriptional regulator [Pseudoalteromonas luteoviolacea]
MSDKHPELNLDNQLCFSLYAASRHITRLYQPMLKQHNLTYPQYIVLLILWQKDGMLVKDIGERAQLKSNTLTPLLKRLEQNGLVTRQRDSEDERQCYVYLTEQGKNLESLCACIPSQMLKQTEMPVEKLIELKQLLDQLMVTEVHGK